MFIIHIQMNNHTPFDNRIQRGKNQLTITCKRQKHKKDGRDKKKKHAAKKLVYTSLT